MKHILMLLGLAALTSLAAPITPPATPVNVLFLGDSLSDGVWNLGDGGHGEAHVEKLQRLLNANAAWTGKVTIHNYAIHGDFITRVLDRLDNKSGTPSLDRFADIWNRDYDWAFVFLGHNDTKTKKATGYLETFVSHADQVSGFADLLGRLRAKGITRIVFYSSESADYDVCKAGDPDTRFGEPRFLEEYNGVIRDLVAANPSDTEYFDIYTEMKVEPLKEVYLDRTDGVHLTPCGHFYMAAREFNYLTGLTAPAYDTPEKIYDGAVAQDVTDWNTAMGTQLKVEAGKTIGITNGTFAVGNGSSADINSYATLVAFKGATLNYAASANSKSFGLNKDYGRYVLDGATFNVVTKNVQRYFGNSKDSRPRYCAWVLTNGSLLASSANGGKNEYRWIVGVGNSMTLVDSTLNTGAYGPGDNGDRHFHFRYAENCTLSATRSTLTLASNPSEFGFVASTNSSIRLADTTVTGPTVLAFSDSSFGNTAEFSGTQGSVSFTTVNMNGAGDTLRLANANFSPTVNLGGTSNCVALAFSDYDVGKLNMADAISPTLAFESPCVKHYKYMDVAAFPKDSFPCFADDRTIDVRNGGVLELERYALISGTNRTIRVRDGGTFYVGLQPSGTANARNALRFVPGATSNCTISVENNGVLETHTAIGMAGSAAAWNWTDCPDSVLVFKGRRPRFNVAVTTDATIGMSLGTSDEDAVLSDPVALRFEVPAENFDGAPIRHDDGTTRSIRLYGNQPIEVVVDPRLVTGSHDKIRIPLVYDCSGFNATTPLDAERLAKLTAHATIPETSKFVVVDDAEGTGKTLCLCIPGNKGLTLIVK